MSMFKVTDDGELVREGGAFVRTSGADEIRQDCSIAPRVIQGEVPWNLRAGFKWFSLLGKTPPEILASSLRSYIGKLPGVTDVVSLEVVPEGNRRVSIPYTARVSTSALARAVLVEDTITAQLPGG